MTKREELQAKKDALFELKERIEAGDAEAIAEGETLQAEIEEMTEEIEQAEKKAALLEKIGNKPIEEEEKMSGIKSLELDALKGRRGTVSTYIKAATDPEKTTQIADVSRVIADGRARLGVRDLFASESISGNALTYFVLGTTEGTIGKINEGAAKSKIHVPYTPKTAALAKIAAYLKETDELLSDADFLESAIRSRGVYEFEKAVESYLVTTLLGTSGVQTGGTTINFDAILAAKQDIMADTGYAADAMIINPTDWATLLQTKDDNKQYLLGGPGFGAYGNGSYFENPKIWGLTVVESAAVPSGRCVIGAFKAAASVVSKAGEGLRVEVSNSDQDDFIKNMITVRIEERLVEAVRVPAAFEIVGTASA